jgi:hypothetical protein
MHEGHRRTRWGLGFKKKKKKKRLSFMNSHFHPRLNQVMDLPQALSIFHSHPKASNQRLPLTNMAVSSGRAPHQDGDGSSPTFLCLVDQ